MENVTWTVTEIPFPNTGAGTVSDPGALDDAAAEPDCDATNETTSEVTGEVARVLAADAEAVAEASTVKDLERVMAYHGIPRARMRKAQMAHAVVLFESDPANYAAVQERMRLWANLDELSRDPYLSRFVSF
jgi:hypothetical protein